MKKGTKITLIVLGVIFAIGIAAFVCADVLVSRLVNKEVNKALVNLPGCEASVGTIHLRFFSATAAVNDLHFAYHGEPLRAKDTIGPGVEIHVDRIDVGRVFYSLLFQRRVLISDVRIKRPQVELWMDENHPELCFPQIHDEGLEKANNVLKDARLMLFAVKNASFKLHSLSSKLDVAVDSCSVKVHDLQYDSVFTYNDSVYEFSLASAAIMFPDGRMRMETHNLSHEDQGAIEIGATRIANTMPRKKLGELVKEPVTWMDMQIESVKIAPLNPIRKALAQDLSLDKIEATVKQMDIFRDERFAPKEPFQMPQEILMAIPATFLVKHVDARINKIDIEFASTDINCGEIHLGDIQAEVDNITNKRGATLTARGGCPIQSGKAKAGFTMTMNKAADFSLKLHAEKINADFLNPFIRPLVGITFELAMDTLDTQYAGNSEKAKGTFRMLYHGLEVQVHKEDNIPYKIVTKNANTFTTLANTLLPKSNPTAVDIHPRAYEVEWKRDVWKPFPLYMFGPCINGAVETLLPGLYVHKEVKNKKSKKK